MIEQQFLKQCKEKAYFIEHQRVLLAISGGLDSMTLLNLLYKYQKELDIELILAHINHKRNCSKTWCKDSYIKFFWSFFRKIS